MADSGRDTGLGVYRRKRRFDQTPEPAGRRRRGTGRSYVIQKHAARRLHYDFRLELDGVLKSWAVTRGPSRDPAQKRLAVRTEDHPVDYGAFEGIIPEGQYGAGTVMLWDRGSWEPLGDPHNGLKRGKLAFRLFGERLKGRWALVRMRDDKRGRKSGARENWLLIKELDDAVERENDVLTEFDTSVATGRDLAAIAAGRTPAAKRKAAASSTNGAAKPAPRKGARTRKLPAFVSPALATLVDSPPSGEDWLFEMKFDGYRALLAASGTTVRIDTRNGHDWTDRFRAIAEAAAELDLDRVLIDGEVVVLDDTGRSDFGRLQRALKGEGGTMAYFAFDLLSEAGKDLRKLPLAERKARLQRLLGGGRRGPIFYTDHVTGDGAHMLATLCKRGFEGIIAKRATAPYRSGRGHDWLKIKCGNEQEFVIAGWSPSTRNRPFASLILAVREGGELRYAGRVGSGFDERTLDDLARRLRKLERDGPAIGGDIPAAIRRKVHWVEPRLVAEVAFAEFTRDGSVRHARFVGLREDKPAGAVVRERPRAVEEAAMAETRSGDTVAGVKLSHPDRVLFAEQNLTKRDLARYYETVAPVMLPEIDDRLVSFVRCPDGRSGECFFQRHAGPGMPAAFRRLAVREAAGKGKRADYIHLAGLEGLVSAAQFGVLEIHIWGSRIDDVERPDRLVFDLDPGDGVDFAEVKRAAADMRSTLDALGLDCVPMLTGGKGIHVVVPITRRYEWPAAKAFCRAVAERLAEASPERFVANMSKARRRGRVFIDYLRNDRTATAIAPFSTRARAGAPVAWPVEWRALSRIEAPAAVSVADVLAGKRKPTTWADYPSRQGLTLAAFRALGVEPDSA